MRPRDWSCLAVFLFVSAMLVFPQQQTVAPNDNPEDQISKLERDWLAADGKGDAAHLREIIADDFIGSSFNGNPLTKDDIIPMDGSPGGFAGAIPGKTSLRVFGDTGVLMGVINNPEGKMRKQLRVTLVCQKRSHGWQIVAVQLSQL